MNISKINIYPDRALLINYLFAFFPISLIIGNLFTNINIVLFCCLSIFHLKSKIFNNKVDSSVIIIFLFFFIVFFSTIFSFFESVYLVGIENTNFEKLIKAILFFRFFIMLYIVYLLSQEDVINFKYFFIVASFLAFLISADVIFQYFLGYNIIGLPSFGHHNTSFFGKELIAGGFIQNFSFFSFLFLFYLLRNNKYLNFLSTTIAISILGIGILLSWNRMPVVLFLFGLFLVFLFNKKLRIIVLSSFFILIISLKILTYHDVKIRLSVLSFYENTGTIISKIFKKTQTEETGVLQESEVVQNKIKNCVRGSSDFCCKPDNALICIVPEQNGYSKLHKIIGNGIKSFREDCHKILISKKGGLCSNHPHNYYLEILTDLGIIGLISILIIALMFIFFLLKNYKSFNVNRIENVFLFAAVISLILEVFPLKSSGSVFTTNNATYIILISSIIISYKKLLEGKNFR